MERTRSLRLAGIIGLSLTMLFLTSCSLWTGSSLKDQVVTKDNSAELAQKAKTELSYEDYELLQEFIKRVYPDQPAGTLPVGMPVGAMIQSQKAFLDAQAAKTGVQEPTGAAAGAEALAPSTEQAATTMPPPAEQTQQPPPRQAAQTPPAKPAPATREPAPTTQISPQPTTEVSSQPATQSSAPAAQTAPAAPAPPPAPAMATLPAGETLTIRLAQALNTKTNQAGQTFEGTLDEDLRAGGALVAPAGSRVIGKITESVASGKVKGRAKMALELTGIEVGGKVYDISTHTLSFEAQGSGKEDAKKVGIASGIGAVIGAIAGGGKGAAIGATIGAGAGTGVVLATPGDEVEFPNEQRMVFKLEKSVELPER